jgi:hypothetical protein
MCFVCNFGEQDGFEVLFYEHVLTYFQCFFFKLWAGNVINQLGISSLTVSGEVNGHPLWSRDSESSVSHTLIEQGVVELRYSDLELLGKQLKVVDMTAQGS